MYAYNVPSYTGKVYYHDLLILKHSNHFHTHFAFCLYFLAAKTSSANGDSEGRTSKNAPKIDHQGFEGSGGAYVLCHMCIHVCV